MTSTVLYKDNITCISQHKDEYIKGDKGLISTFPQLLHSEFFIKIVKFNIQEMGTRENIDDDIHQVTSSCNMQYFSSLFMTSNFSTHRYQLKWSSGGDDKH